MIKSESLELEPGDQHFKKSARIENQGSNALKSESVLSFHAGRSSLGQDP